MIRRVALAALFGLAVFGCSPSSRKPPESLTVFAAASLTDVLEKIASDYERDTGQSVRLSFAASGAVARQIRAGAPADIVVLADGVWMDRLSAEGVLDDQSRFNLLANRLVLIAGDQVEVAGDPLTWVQSRGGRLAIGDPGSVPAGMYARTWLTAVGRWDALQPAIVTAADVRAVRTFVTRGEADLGIVYKSDAVGANGLRIVLDPPDAQQPEILYPAARLRMSAPQAGAFLRYVQAPKARAVFEAAGFRPL